MHTDLGQSEIKEAMSAWDEDVRDRLVEGGPDDVKSSLRKRGKDQLEQRSGIKINKRPLPKKTQSALLIGFCIFVVMAIGLAVFLV